MSAQTTPGQWAVEPNGDQPEADGFNIVDTEGHYVAFVDPATTGNVEAWAKLIAAAPEMRRWLARWCDYKSGTLDYPDTTLREELKAVRELLANIDGEAR